MSPDQMHALLLTLADMRLAVARLEMHVASLERENSELRAAATSQTTDPVR